MFVRRSLSQVAFVLATTAMAVGCSAPERRGHATSVPVVEDDPTVFCRPVDASDWIDDRDWTTRRLTPRDCVRAQDDPPTFMWPIPPDHDPGTPMRVVIEGEGRRIELLAKRPWATPERALGAGRYAWRVVARTRDGRTIDSAVRRFAIDRSAQRVEWPDEAGFVALARNATRPRLMPRADKAQRLRETYRTSRADVHAAFLEHARASVDDAVDPADMASLPGAVTVQALAWRLTGLTRHRDAALARMRELLAMPASRDPGIEHRGGQVDRAVALGLARGIDLLDDALDRPTRARALAAAHERLAHFHASEIASDAFVRMPYRSHGAATLAFALESLVLLAGEHDALDRMLADVWEIYRHVFPVWGEQDGSDGNGTAYGWTNNFTQTPYAWVTVENATGVDLSRRAYARHMGRQLYLLPPTRAERGADGPSAPFGDGATANRWYFAQATREFAVYARLVPDPLYAWYRDQAALRAPYTRDAAYRPYARAFELLAPVRPGDAQATPELPAHTPNAIAFRDTGVVAMHDRLHDPMRTSVYFVSGRFGSFGHSPAEQNAFVLHARGAPLLVSGGAYDAYLSPHHARYTRRTLSKNAITVDGGIGQAEDLAGAHVPSMQFRGRLLGAKTEGPVLWATGDARLAYRRFDARSGQLEPLLTHAIRTVAFVPSAQLVFVYDRLMAPVPRRFEVNLQSLEPFERDARDPGAIVVRGGPARACVNLHGPAHAFRQATPWSDMPPPPSPTPAQYRGTFALDAPTRDAALLTVIRVGCGGGEIDVRRDASPGSYTVRIAASGSERPIRLRFDDDATDGRFEPDEDMQRR